MRVIETHIFKLSKKIPFSEYPDIVHRFLSEQGLHFNKFMYYFDELVLGQTKEEALVSGSCAKAIKDCPVLGDIRFLTFDNYFYTFLSNIDGDTGCTGADILPNIKKIHRRYGFSHIDIYYYDIDFFNDVIPFSRDMSYAEARAYFYRCDYDPAGKLYDQPYGSCIRLHRDHISESYISVSVDLLHNGIIHDASGYFSAMKALFPGVRPTVSMKIYLTDAEKQEIANWDDKFAPLKEEINNYLTERFPTKDKQNLLSSSYTIAPKLKTLAKQYGYTYTYVGNGYFELRKRTPMGHVLRMFADSGPSHYDTTYGVILQGIGFRHCLFSSMQTPTNQEESDKCSEDFFALFPEFEKEFIQQIDAFYNETPDWFVATDF